MALKIVLVCCVAAVILEYTLAAPHNSRREQDLKKSFVEFLQQDKELSELIERANVGNGPALSRSVRQAEEEQMSDEQDVETDSKQAGFFDRAAKFVMEVLQRFLKWINTDN